MHILLVDNYDSFTYNLAHYLEQFCPRVTVWRNDAFSVSEAAPFSHLVISPGPGLPPENGITEKLVKTYFHKKPILGICLGCQALAQYAGGSLYPQNEVAHGIGRTVVKSNSHYLLENLPSTFKVGLYHSWAIAATESLQKHFRIAARRENGVLMAIEHRYLPVAGIQFHPESILTENGLPLLQNWWQHTLT